MQKKVLIVVFGTFLLVALLFVLFNSKREQSTINYAPVATMQVLDEKNKEQNYIIHMEYPKLSNVPSVVSEEKVNTAVEAFAKDTADMFKNEISKKNPRGDFPNVLTMQYSVDRLTKGQFVVTFTIADFKSGVKQPKTTTKTFSFEP